MSAISVEHLPTKARHNCPVAGCKKTFGQKSDATRHVLNVHHGRKYHCEVCPKSFSSKEMYKQIGAQGHPDLSEDCVFSGTDERLNLQVGVFQGSWHSFESLRCLITLTLYEGVQNSVSPKLKSAMRSSRRPSKCIANCDSVRFQFCTGCVQRSDA